MLNIEELNNKVGSKPKYPGAFGFRSECMGLGDLQEILFFVGSAPRYTLKVSTPL